MSLTSLPTTAGHAPSNVRSCRSSPTPLAAAYQAQVHLAAPTGKEYDPARKELTMHTPPRTWPLPQQAPRSTVVHVFAYAAFPSPHASARNAREPCINFTRACGFPFPCRVPSLDRGPPLPCFHCGMRVSGWGGYVGQCHTFAPCPRSYMFREGERSTRQKRARHEHR